MKIRVEKISEEEALRQFPVAGRVQGWFFRVDEVSAGVYLVEGTDLWGRRVSRKGTDPDELLASCAVDADEILRSISAASKS
jgi:hypothetical protein